MPEPIRQQAKELWCKTFGDSEEFVERFLNLYFDNRHFFCSENNGELQAMLFILDYSLRIHSAEYKGAYLYAFCSVPQYRGSGLASGLLQQTERILSSSGYDYLFLIAASEGLIDYYERLSFRCCRSHKMTAYKKELSESIKTKNLCFERSHSIDIAAYRHLAETRDNSVMHSEGDLSLYQQGGYDIYYMSEEEEVCAMAVTLKKDDKVVVLDSLGKDTSCADCLLGYVYTQNNQCDLLQPSRLLQTQSEDFRSPYMIKSLQGTRNPLPERLYFNLLLDK